MSEKMTDEEIDKLLVDLESPVIETDYGPAVLGSCALAAQVIRELRKDSALRYFASGPDGSFWTDDLRVARMMLDAYDKRGDWTVTDCATEAQTLLRDQGQSDE